MNPCITNLLNQAFEQYKMGDHIVKSSYDIYVESLARHSEKEKGVNYCEVMDYWNSLKEVKNEK